MSVNLDAYQYNYTNGVRITASTTASAATLLPKTSGGVFPRYIRIVAENSTTASNIYFALGGASMALATLNGVLINPNEPFLVQTGGNAYISVITSAGTPIVSISAVEW